ncbi:hypothetical protein GCM10009559_29060 [Pseudonocardia zijingensis]|uniref:Uncharacterized protein n=1 Tax=Pseudonocardia zijingensis TaxID=153376 RepID=A0ABN1Q3T8_9PSEU
MCGRPAVPSTSASPSDKKSIFAVVLAPYCRPGISSRSPSSLGAALAEVCTCGLASTAWPSSADRLNPNLPSTQTVMIAVPMSRRVALMICTHVVPFMPPTST